jgi:hypothetical protein
LSPATRTRLLSTPSSKARAGWRLHARGDEGRVGRRDGGARRHPYSLFLPHASVEELDRFVARIVELFRGRLILGISDELPPPADVGRMKRVSQLLEKLEGRR